MTSLSRRFNLLVIEPAASLRHVGYMPDPTDLTQILETLKKYQITAHVYFVDTNFGQSLTLDDQYRIAEYPAEYVTIVPTDIHTFRNMYPQVGTDKATTMIIDYGNRMSGFETAEFCHFDYNHLANFYYIGSCAARVSAALVFQPVSNVYFQPILNKYARAAYSLLSGDSIQQPIPIYDQAFIWLTLSKLVKQYLALKAGQDWVIQHSYFVHQTTNKGTILTLTYHTIEEFAIHNRLTLKSDSALDLEALGDYIAARADKLSDQWHRSPDSTSCYNMYLS